MKKPILIILSVLLSLAIILPGTTAVMAESEKEAKPQAVARAALMIRAPNIAEVGQPVTITVFGKFNHQPIAAAEVYALKTDRIAITADQNNYYGKKIDVISTPVITPRPTIASVFNAIISRLKTKPAPSSVGANATEVRAVKIAEQVENAEDIEKNGILLGYTNEKGELVYTFNETGYFALAAVKKGYDPGFARINVRLTSQKALGIKVPDKADVNQPVTMTVFERQTSQVIPGARVYALRMGDVFAAIPAEKPTTTILTPQPTSVALDASVDADTIKAKGIFLGETDDNGQLVHSFDRSGRYVLAAIKDEYLPGFARISIGLASQKALAIRAPDQAEVGDPVNIGVFERNTSQPIPRAAVYALRLGDVIIPQAANSTTKTEPAAVIELGNAETIKSKGLLIGYTDDKGMLTHSFEKNGRYVLAAIKDEYKPGFARINIMLAAQKAIGIKVPDRAEAGKPINIVTYDRNNYQPVPKAAVYALRIGEPDGAIPLPFEALIKPEATSSAEAEKNAADIKMKGIFLGYTNENAHLAYAFEKPGHYLLVAIKDTYLPGFARINIISSKIVPGPTDIGTPK